MIRTPFGSHRILIIYFLFSLCFHVSGSSRKRGVWGMEQIEGVRRCPMVVSDPTTVLAFLPLQVGGWHNPVAVVELKRGAPLFVLSPDHLQRRLLQRRSCFQRTRNMRVVTQSPYCEQVCVGLGATTSLFGAHVSINGGGCLERAHGRSARRPYGAPHQDPRAHSGCCNISHAPKPAAATCLCCSLGMHQSRSP